jgi:hypothetical protein
MQLDGGVLVAGLAPLSLLMGPPAAAGTLVALVFLSFRSKGILSHRERTLLIHTFETFASAHLPGRKSR